MQHFTSLDIIGLAWALLVLISVGVIWLAGRSAKRWPNEGHGETYFGNSRRVPEDD